MGNLKKAARREPVSVTYPEWLGVSASIGAAARLWSTRAEIVAFAGPSAGLGNPACFSPNTAELEINTEICFGDDVQPDDIRDIDKMSGQVEFPRATGAIFHEAMHARYSLWDLEKAAKELTPREFTALILLEEGRIESHGLKVFPRMSGFLRRMAVDVVVNDQSEIADSSDSVFAGNVALLTLARVDAGSLEEVDVEKIYDLVLERFGADKLAELRELWLTAQAHDRHYDVTDLYPVARRWVEIIDEIAVENGEEKPGDGQPGDEAEGDEAEGDSGSSSSSASGESESTSGRASSSSFQEQMQDALQDAAEESTIGSYDDIADAEQAAEYEESAADRAKNAKDRRSDIQEAAKVFGSGTADVHGTRSYSSLMETRKPTSDERRAAVKVSQLLDKAKYRERSETEISSVIPPGRLRTRAAVQQTALRSKGIMSEVEPWRRTTRKHTDDPTLDIGIMVDISGSMGGAMESMASAAWILSEASRRVQARAAMVYYGNDVFPTLKPGQHLDQVRVWSAPDMTEKFGAAFKALNGALDLTRGSGAKLLVIVSDGEYTGVETVAVQRALTACDASGVGVLWVTPNSYIGAARSHVAGTGAVTTPLKDDVVEFADEIGRAAVRVLEAAR